MIAKKLYSPAVALLVATLLAACGQDGSQSDPRLARSVGNRAATSCVDGGVLHASGTGWRCSDGCNSCSCENGVVTSTLLACLAK